MKKEKYYNSDGSLPNAVVHQLYEHTVGGFIIFYFNQDTGRPEQMMSFDSPAHSLALQKHISDWNEAVHQVNLENSVNNIQAHIENNNDEEDENGSQ